MTELGFCALVIIGFAAAFTGIFGQLGFIYTFIGMLLLFKHIPTEDMIIYWVGCVSATLIHLLAVYLSKKKIWSSLFGIVLSFLVVLLLGTEHYMTISDTAFFIIPGLGLVFLTSIEPEKKKPCKVTYDKIPKKNTSLGYRKKEV